MSNLLTRDNLHPYQQSVIELARTKDNIGLLLDMGLGKSSIVLTILSDSPKGKALIVAPLSVARNVWEQETKKWEHLKHLSVSKILGTEDQRLDALKKDADIYVINNENLVWLFEQEGALTKFDYLVIDESSKFKDPSTKRFKALKKALRNFKRRIIATGTPTPQSLQDIWSQVGILDLGERLGTSLTKFRDTYLEPDQRNRHTHVVYSWRLKEGAEAEIKGRIKDICYSMKAEDYLTLPERTSTYHNIEMPLNIKAKYDTLRKDMVLETDNETITAVSAAALSNKLLQFSSGSLYVENGDAIEQHSLKLDYLEDMLDENVPTLLFYHFKSSLASLQKRFPHAVVLDNKPETIAKWQKGEIKLLLAHPQSSGMGINLQCNTAEVAHIIWYDLPWSSENYIQANARIHRQGQTKPVIIHHLCLMNSIDWHVVKVLEGKINLQEAVLNSLNFALV